MVIGCKLILTLCGDRLYINLRKYHASMRLHYLKWLSWRRPIFNSILICSSKYFIVEIITWVIVYLIAGGFLLLRLDSYGLSSAPLPRKSFCKPLPNTSDIISIKYTFIFFFVKNCNHFLFLYGLVIAFNCRF